MNKIFRSGQIMLLIILFYQMVCQSSTSPKLDAPEKYIPDCGLDSFWISSRDNNLKIGWFVYPNCTYRIIATFKGKRDTLDYQQFVWEELTEILLEDKQGVKQRIIMINDSTYAFDSPYLEGFGSYLIGVQIKNQAPVIQKSNWIYGQEAFIWDKNKKTITIHVERGENPTYVWDISHFPARLIKK